ncbi:MAG: GTPase ObgE [Opitutales bacterium]|jgi:GTP-binding protein
MFVDEASVKLRAGDGGTGSASFRREKFLPRGGPDGGDGGNGGHVIMDCDENTSDLRAYAYKPHWRADDGERGRGRQQTGAGGRDCVLKVPPGTIAYDLEGRVCAEVLTHGQQVILLRGGNGGIGNLHFKSSINRAPRQFTVGKPGEAAPFRFVLKSIADAGLVGFPNAGKSTLTGMITSASPRVGAYPFTTLRPSVGVIDYLERYEKLTLADIPGLIEGAHENKGLGHRFLRHIERCKILMYIVDMAGTDTRDPADDFDNLRKELSCYSPALPEKPSLVLANKMDEAAAEENLVAFKARFPDIDVLPISCLSGLGLPELKERIYRMVKAL